MSGPAEQISAWIASQASGAGRTGAVLGLSGGIDSAVVAALAKRALGDEVLGVIMPCNSLPQDEEHALLLADHIGLRVEKVDLAQAYGEMARLLPEGSDLAQANIKPRLRMITLYHFAASLDSLVLGTGNRTELMIGYFTKHGDGACDLLPIGGLYKSQVREIARELGLPAVLIDKPPSAGLWEGQTDEDEIGMTYDQLDAALAVIEDGREAGELAPDIIDRVRDMVASTAHKRCLAPVCTMP